MNTFTGEDQKGEKMELWQIIPSTISHGLQGESFFNNSQERGRRDSQSSNVRTT